MKLLIPLLALAATLSLTSMASANTALVLGSGKVTIAGSARSTSKVTAMAYYTPTSELASGKLPAACVFSEDEYSSNGEGKVVNLTATQSIGSDKVPSGYSINIATAGLRGKCPYMLSSFYLYVDDGKQIHQTFNLQTSAIVASQDKSLGSDTSQDPASLSTLGTLYCDYESKDSDVQCDGKDGILSGQFQVSSSPGVYELNIEDSSLKPNPED